MAAIDDLNAQVAALTTADAAFKQAVVTTLTDVSSQVAALKAQIAAQAPTSARRSPRCRAPYPISPRPPSSSSAPIRAQTTAPAPTPPTPPPAS